MKWNLLCDELPLKWIFPSFSLLQSKAKCHENDDDCDYCRRVSVCERKKINFKDLLELSRSIQFHFLMNDLWDLRQWQQCHEEIYSSSRSLHFSFHVRIRIFLLLLLLSFNSLILAFWLVFISLLFEQKNFYFFITKKNHIQHFSRSFWGWNWKIGCDTKRD